MIGYEINQIVGNKTSKNLARYKNVKIVSENIFDNFPIEANLFYLYNPFNKDTMEIFKESIWSIRDNNPRILYYNSKFISVFDDNRFKYEVITNFDEQIGRIVDLAIIQIKN